jgi:hypothetical protein
MAVGEREMHFRIGVSVCGGRSIVDVLDDRRFEKHTALPEKDLSVVDHD